MKEVKGIFVISDCADPNAQSRYIAAFGRELNAPVYCLPATYPLEAAGCGIDIIDELKGCNSVVFINIAPRRDADKATGHKNGRPFLYFFVGKTLVVTSDVPEIYGLFQKVGVDFSDLREIDLFEVDNIPSYSQFRSAQCVPIVVRQILERAYTGKPYKLSVKEVGSQIWFVDNFGNCKTTLTSFTEKRDIQRVEHLTNVPDSTTAQTISSSGYRDVRFIEFIIKGGSYAKQYNLKVGDYI